MKQVVLVVAGLVVGISIVIIYLNHFQSPDIAPVGIELDDPQETETIIITDKDGDEELAEYLSEAIGSPVKPLTRPQAKVESVPKEESVGATTPMKSRPLKAKVFPGGLKVSDEDLFWARVEEPNPFIKYIMKAVDKPASMVLFTGHSAKTIFDMNPPAGPSRVSITGTTARERMGMYKHLTLSGRTNTRVWRDIATLVNETMSWNSAHYNNLEDQPINSVVRVHNEHKVGDLLLHIVEEAKRNRRAEGTFSKYGNALVTRSEILRVMDQGQPPVVMTNSVDENWGFLSTGINTRTTEWINMTNHLRIHESNFDTLKAFLDSDKVLLLLTNTHIAPQIGAHPKVLSLPLGFREMPKHHKKAKEVLAAGVKKRRLMQINNSGWGDRAVINEEIKRAFKGTVENTYRGAKTINDTDRGMGGPIDHAKRRRERQRRRKEREMAQAKDKGVASGAEARRRRRLVGISPAHGRDHLLETAESRYALCPSGLGMDTYRLWQILLLGTIPVVESNPGFDRTYSRLPVLVVRNYTDLTPSLLRRAYPCFRENAHRFDFRALTLPYWLDLVDEAVRTGSIDHVTRQHPYRNAYCDFLK